jgi:hypothetical protein
MLVCTYREAFVIMKLSRCFEWSRMCSSGIGESPLNKNIVQLTMQRKVIFCLQKSHRFNLGAFSLLDDLTLRFFS